MMAVIAALETEPLTAALVRATPLTTKLPLTRLVSGAPGKLVTTTGRYNNAYCFMYVKYIAALIRPEYLAARVPGLAGSTKHVTGRAYPLIPVTYGTYSLDVSISEFP